jgi:hypothetical protein
MRFHPRKYTMTEVIREAIDIPKILPQIKPSNTAPFL